MNNSRNTLHDLALQKHTSLYLGDSTLSPQRVQRAQDQSGLCKTAFRSLTSDTSGPTRQEMLSLIKTHPFLKFESPNEQSFQQYYDACSKEEEEQKYLIAEHMKAKQARKAQVSSKRLVKETTSVLVPSFLQSLIGDIKKLQETKNILKKKYYLTKEPTALQQILIINNLKLKALLTQLSQKTLNISCNQQLSLQELQTLVILSVSEDSKQFQGWDRGGLLTLLMNNLREIVLEERENSLHPGSME